MIHRLFKPHVTGPEGHITTPDIVIDRISLFVDGDSRFLPVQRLVSDSALHAGPGDTDITPAYALVASGGGVLLGFAALVRLSGEPVSNADVVVARSTWRYRNVADHLGALRLDARADSDKKSVVLSQLAQPADIMDQSDGDELALPRGIVALCAAPDATVTCRSPADVVVQLSDADLDRSLSNRTGLVPVDTDHWRERPLPRYTVGPVEEVQHYI